MPAASTQAKPLRVLVIDDDANERQLAVTVLNASGECEAVPVADAIAFGEELARGTFDAAVLEAKVRWADALAILDAVKRAGRHRAVVLFTAPGSDEATIAAFKRGLDESVAKSPKGFVELPSAVRAAVRRVTAQDGAAETSLARLLERLDRAVFQCELDGQVVDANRSFVELLGFSLRTDALRANAFDLCLPAAGRDDVLQRLREQRFVMEDSLSIVALDGRPLTITLALSLVTDDRRGKIVTGLVERAAAPVAANRPPGLDTLPSRAMALAHDLKEPLRTIVRATDQLKTRLGDRLDTESLEQLNFLRDAAGRMQGQVKKLFEKPASAGVEEVERTNGDDVVALPDEASEASLVLRQVLDLLRASIETSGARVTFDSLPTVAVAPDSLLQLFQNVLGNALKFRRSEPPRVHVSAERRDGEWLFSVADNGVGIAPQHAEKIFEMFDRGAAPKAVPGTGIGLAVCKRIVERHGGRIWVHSTPGEGATFFFSLPAAAAATSPKPLRFRPKVADRS